MDVGDARKSKDYLKASIKKWTLIVRILKDPNIIKLPIEKRCEIKFHTLQKCGLCYLAAEKAGAYVDDIELVCPKCLLTNKYEGCLDHDGHGDDNLFTEIGNHFDGFQEKPTELKRAELLALSEEMLERIESLKEEVCMNQSLIDGQKEMVK